MFAREEVLKAKQQNLINLVNECEIERQQYYQKIAEQQMKEIESNKNEVLIDFCLDLKYELSCINLSRLDLEIVYDIIDKLYEKYN